ncbi:hypothetical protein [Aquisalimonas asiatica]|uniref:Uncharacterized protein n=1 Tax=Aquisalimonas asiatica TaxID=406100 RepID=A0A1H8PYR1_9GAMM|nr:hypothetical protein [Aquisalimonas asiatica]SEO46878.1 hypothetical protein SAMN04488052_101231 [Aquisalimonas asiatica]
MLADILYIWSDSPGLSLAIWLVIGITVLYLGRPHAHHVLRGTGRAIDGALRLAAASLRQLEKRVAKRNRDVLLAVGREEAEKAIEREFTRVNAIVERELSHYPALHRKLAETIEKIEGDYQASTDQAPLPPDWSELTSTISSLPSSGDPAVGKILENIREAVENSHKETLKAYQKSVNERHKILHGMQGDWRTVSTTMDKVQTTITGLEERAAAIDRHMANYEAMRREDDKAVHALTASSVTQFFIASLVLVIAAFGGLINFHLIALPMSEMVGGAAYIGSMRVSDIAALVIIMVEISMGIFLLEALQITKLFPMIGRMDDRMRKRMAIAAFTILFIFASIEASLAYMRDLLVMDQQALTQSLAGGAAAEAQFRWIPSVAQLLLGFILPFALAFVAIPLEAFINSLRTVLGLLVLGVVRVLPVVVRLAGGVASHLSKVLVSLYDLLIMLPLSIERMIAHRRETAHAVDEDDTDADTPAKPKTKRRRRASSDADTDDTQLTEREA